VRVYSNKTYRCVVKTDGVHYRRIALNSAETSYRVFTITPPDEEYLRERYDSLPDTILHLLGENLELN
jgi:hypothetical protein